MEIRLRRGIEANLWDESLDQIRLFGVPISRVTRTNALDQVARWIENGDRARLVFTPDTTALMRARQDEDLLSAYSEADLVTADGTGILLASRLFGCALSERVTGIDLMEALCASASDRGDRVFFLGAKPGIADLAMRNLAAKYPGLNVVGARHGYFEANDEDKLISQINESRPDLLFVGMGVPKQERWIMENRDRLDVPVIMGIGGSFDVFAGVVNRAPVLWQRAGMEWLWRTLREPWRLRRIRVIPAFLIEICLYRLLTSISSPF